MKDEFMRPIVMPERYEVDPLTRLYGVMEHLKADERAVIQVLFKGTVNPWAESILRSVTDSKSDSFFMDAPEMPKLAQEKTSAPLFAVVIRAIVEIGGLRYASKTKSQKANHWLSLFPQPLHAALKLLKPDKYSEIRHFFSFTAVQKIPMIHATIFDLCTS